MSKNSKSNKDRKPFLDTSKVNPSDNIQVSSFDQRRHK